MVKELFIGIDGGGTKTEIALFDADGHKKGNLILPSCHILQESEKIIGERLNQGVKDLLIKSKADNPIVTIGFGLAGYASPKNKEKIHKILAKVFPQFSYIVASDAEIALLGAFEGRPGILIVAGTGSIGLKYSQGRFIRCGGWGYLYGDEGSAYWVGRKLLTTYTKQADGRMKKTLLFNYFNHKYNLSNTLELLNVVQSKNPSLRTAIASFAVDATTLCWQGDKQVLSIYKEAARELAGLANALVEGETASSLVLVGSLWKAGEFLLEPFRQALDNKILITEAKHEATYGAFLMAKRYKEQNKK